MTIFIAAVVVVEEKPNSSEKTKQAQLAPALVPSDTISNIATPSSNIISTIYRTTKESKTKYKRSLNITINDFNNSILSKIIFLSSD